VLQIDLCWWTKSLSWLAFSVCESRLSILQLIYRLRYSVIEAQALLIETIGKLEWSLSEKATRIRREACGLVVPTVEGEVEKGVQMPLVVSIAP